MEKILEPWVHARAVIAGGLQINDRLTKEGKTWEDVREYLENNKDAPIIKRDPSKKIIIQKVCPNCGKRMNGSDLHRNSEKYQEGYRSYWLCGASCCTGKGCGYEEFSRLTINDNLKNILQNKK